MFKSIQYIIISFLIILITSIVTFLILDPSLRNSLTRFKFYLVSSGSMEPSIKLGSIIFTISQSSYSPGDIITFIPGDNKKTVVTHRIKFKESLNSGESFKTAGDANEDLDKWDVPQSNVIGKVVLTIPYLGYLVNFAKYPQGFIALVIIPATIVIYEELKRLSNETGKFFNAFLNKEKKKFKGIYINLLPQKNTPSFPKYALIFPLIGGLVVFVAISGAFLKDSEQSLSNILGAAASFSPKQALVEPLFSPIPQEASVSAASKEASSSATISEIQI